MSNITGRLSYPFTGAYVDAGNTLMMPPPLLLLSQPLASQSAGRSLPPQHRPPWRND